jgi:hypothetical protein
MSTDDEYHWPQLVRSWRAAPFRRANVSRDWGDERDPSNALGSLWAKLIVRVV